MTESSTVRQTPQALRPRPRRGTIDGGRYSPIAYLIMAVVAILTLYPMLWMIFGSLKSSGEFYTNIWSWPHQWTWDNFGEAWQQGALGQKFINSTIATGGTLVLVLALASTAGYALAKVRFPLHRWIYYFVLAGIMIPFGVAAIPIVTVTINLGIFNTRLGLILVYAAQSVPFGVFLMATFFRSVPDELEEAAFVDGCTRFGAFMRVILPLAKPGLVTLLIFVGTSTWNEYLMASVLIHQPNLETLPQGLVVFTTQHTTNYPQLFAALTTVTAPLVIVYLAAQRQFISGMTAGALKG